MTEPHVIVSLDPAVPVKHGDTVGMTFTMTLDGHGKYHAVAASAEKAAKAITLLNDGLAGEPERESDDVLRVRALVHLGPPMMIRGIADELGISVARVHQAVDQLLPKREIRLSPDGWVPWR